jgi:hypothetical protein
MAFMLIDLDRKPMRVKGAALLAGVAVSDTNVPIGKGIYRALRSGAAITVLNSGGSVLPQEAARAGFAISRPVPISIDAAEFLVPQPFDEVFTSVGERVSVEDLKFQVAPLVGNVEGFWIPVAFSSHGEQWATGWVRQSKDELEARVVHADGMSLSGSTIRVVPVHAPTSAFEVVVSTDDGNRSQT